MTHGIYACTLLALLAGCATPEIPLKPDYEKHTVLVQLAVVPQERISNTCAALANDPGRLSGACARHSRDDRPCQIFAVEPGHLHDTGAFAALGHELWHCFRGSFHD
jgi:hypothetical protein